MALVGGTAYCRWDNLILFSKAQALSAKGSRPFDADADGLVVGEGYVFLVVKSLARALADADRIRAVVPGVGISSDGRGKSLWAPQKEGQVQAIAQAYTDGIEASRVQYIEAHATSTPVGDATEMAALSAALGPRLDPSARIPVGSVKANIGHALEAAGGAGVIKAALAMQHSVIPRQINFAEPSPQIDWPNSPFFVPRENLPWPPNADGFPRRAAVNAFGIGGLNGHVMVDEFLPAASARSYPAAGPFGGASSCPADGRPPAPPATISGDDRAVAVIGAACIFPEAPALEAFWELISSGRDARSAAPTQRGGKPQREDPEHKAAAVPRLGGFITGFQYDWQRHKIPPLQIARANPLQFMVLDCVEAALRDAACDLSSYDKCRVMVIAGTQFGSDFLDQLSIGTRLPQLKRILADVLRRHGAAADQIEAAVTACGRELLRQLPALLDDTGSFSTSTLASRVGKVYDLMGGARALDAGRAWSLAAVSTAIDSLLCGACDLVICSDTCT